MTRIAALGMGLALVGTGCGSDGNASDGAEDVTGAESTDTTETDTTETDTTETDTTETETTETDTTETGGEVCEEWDDHYGDDITIRFVNERDTPIFLEAWVFCGDSGVPMIATRDGVAFQHRGGPDSMTCTELMNGYCGCEGGGETGPESLIKIDPGASHQEPWYGSAVADATLPEACKMNPDICLSNGCLQLVDAGPGSYAFTASAGTAMPEGLGECTTFNGTCTMPDVGAGPGGELLEATGTVTLPGGSSVEIVFD